MYNIISLELYQMNPEIDIQCIDDGECNFKGKCSSNKCQCDQGYFMNDCSLSDENIYLEYLQTKKSVADKLQEFLNEENKIQSKLIKDQVVKSINLINKDKDLYKVQS